MDEKQYKPVQDDEVRLDWSQPESTLLDRHGREPAPDDFEGPYWSEYLSDTDGEFEYLELTIGWGEYTIPVTHSVNPWPSEDGPKIVERVLFDDDRLVLEAVGDDGTEYLMTETGWTQTEDIAFDWKPCDSRIEHPDAVLWDRG